MKIQGRQKTRCNKVFQYLPQLQFIHLHFFYNRVQTLHQSSNPLRFSGDFKIIIQKNLNITIIIPPYGFHPDTHLRRHMASSTDMASSSTGLDDLQRFWMKNQTYSVIGTIKKMQSWSVFQIQSFPTVFRTNSNSNHLLILTYPRT